MLHGVTREITFDGCRVRYVRAGTPGRPLVLLVHGGGAHHGWWAGVVPELAERFDLIIPDLSGHGDSEHREHYGPELWAAELAAIVEQEGGGPVSYVGHSMGGLVGVFMAARLGHIVDALVLVDSGLRWPGENGSEPRGRPRRATRVYPTEEAALEHFRLRPIETSADPALLEKVGRHALKRVEDGWTWKFDPKGSQRFTDASLHAELPRVGCPVGMIYGEHSEIASQENVAYVESRLNREVPSIPIAGAYHHVPLDAPEACGAAIERLLRELSPSSLRLSASSDHVRQASVEVDG